MKSLGKLGFFQWCRAGTETRDGWVRRSAWNTQIIQMNRLNVAWPSSSLPDTGVWDGWLQQSCNGGQSIERREAATRGISPIQRIWTLD